MIRRFSATGARRWSVILSAGLLASTLGCETFRSGANPELPPWTYRPSHSLSVIYKRNVVAESRRAGEPYERGQPELDPARRRLFLGSSDHGLYALDAADGSTLWRFETLGFVQCAPLYDARENVVYFGSNDGALYKVHADSGRLIWRFMTNAEVARRPVLSGGRLYAMNANDTLLALDPKTGELLWSQHRTPALAMEIAGYSGPLVFRGKVYAGFSDGTVTAFDAESGTESWQPVDLSAEAEQALGEIPPYLDVDTTPLAGDIAGSSVIYVGSYLGGVFALDAASGAQVWSNLSAGSVTELALYQEPARTVSAERPPEPARKLLIAATGTTGLWALDPETGQEVWRRTLPRGGVSAPVPILGALLVSTTELGVFLLSPLDGGLIDGLHLADGASGTPAVYGRRAFVATNNGSLLSILVAPPGEPAARPEKRQRF